MLLFIKMPFAKLYTALIDMLFPPRADECAVRLLTEDSVRERYHPHHAREWTALTSFQDPSIRALIHEAKYERNIHAQKLLAVLITQYSGELETNTETVWVPIPLSPARLRARGYNQIEAILTHTRGTVVHALTRIRDTKPQTTLTRAERLSNMEHAFQVTDPQRIKDRNVIIIDDVVTTGATLRAAKAQLLPHGPTSITLLALAH